METADASRDQRLRGYRQAAQWSVLVGLFASIVYGAGVAPSGRGVIAGVAAFLAAAAPFALGVLIGFLFGIPKTRQDPTEGGQHDTVQVNTNLEQVSDWLTKILVGVGLTQLTVLPAQLQGVADYIQRAITGGSDTGAAVVASILVYFAISGFLWGYLVTRLILEPELGRLEPDPDVVARVANARPSSTGAEAVDKRDAAEVLRFPLEQLKTPEQVIAWGRAKLDRDPAGAVDALSKALKQVPFDRRAVENLAFAALYAPPPDGFTRAIDVTRGYLEAHGRDASPDDADLYAYLACAYGQQYRWERDHGAPQEQLELIRARAIDAIKSALKLGPYWKPELRRLLHPEPGSPEDDLAVFADQLEIKKLLDV